MVDIHHAFFGSSADIEFRLRVVRNNIGGIPTLCDNPVDFHISRQLLPHQSDCVEHQNHGIQGIDTVLRSGRSMRGFPFKFYPNRGAGDFFMCQFVMIGTRMYTQCSIYVLKEAFPNEAALCASVFSALFTGRAVDTHFTADFINHLL